METAHVHLTCYWQEILPGIEMRIHGNYAVTARTEIRFTGYDCGCGLSRKHYTPQQHEDAMKALADIFYLEGSG
jgi:hypothetical protein